MANKTGTPGNDTLTGTASADQLFGLAGNDILNGLAGNDSLNGGGGNDTLDGGIGIDTLIGGGGNDTYIVDNISDTVTEAANSGVDTVVSSVSYTLGSNFLDNLTLTGTSAINGTGNSLNNIIIGNVADNILYGDFGNDTLYGGGGNDILRDGSDDGNDILYGGDGNDILDGGTGEDFFYYGETDTLYGGDGNDTLYGIETRFGYANNGDFLYGGNGNDIYVLRSRGDTIKESANSAIDTVQAPFSYTLGSNVENLTLTQDDRFEGEIIGIGNSLNNIIIGNATGYHILKGEAGNDNLNGAAGNDLLVGSSGAVGETDTLSGKAGRDTFFLGNTTQVFYDDRNRATAGRGDYASITDFNSSQDIIRLNGRRSDYFLGASPTGLPTGTAIYRNKPASETDELIAIVQGSSALSLSGNYFRFTADEINLSTLNSSNGFKINGIDADDRLGTSVSSAGDINGDGLDDLIIGASGADPNGQNSAGESYVVFGKVGAFGTSLNLSTLDGTNGFVINGIDADDSSGGSVSSAGDINGDGLDDLIIGAIGAAPNGQSAAGESYVVFGKVTNFSTSLNLSALDGTNGFVINGIDTFDLSGTSVSSAGDINGDGLDDLIIGAIGAAPNSRSFAGESYVVFGKATNFDSSLNLSILNGTNGFVINGISERDYSGTSVSSAGDINGDGLDDLIIGAPKSPYGYSTGSIYVVFGKATNFGASLNVSALDGTNGFKISGASYSSSGASVSSAGDINGDGFDDLIIDSRESFGRRGYNDPFEPRKSYVVFGKATGFDPSLSLPTLNGTNGFKINGFSGTSVSSAGDVNSDGFDDLIIGAGGADPNGQISAGSSYVVFGKARGFGISLDLLDINGSNGFVINGIDADDFSGSSVSSAGDVNGDGFDDLMVGASGANPNGQSRAGESYVIFGRDFTGSVTNAGTAGNDTLTGTAGNDILIGGLGNDRLIGGKGVDVLIGGAGNDTLSFGAIDRRSNGGSGIDTLRIDGSDSIDLTTIANNKFTAFEIIDITGTGNNSLAFTRLDLLDLSDTTNRLIVNGNAGDKVTSTGQGWTIGGKTTVDSVLYRQYTVGAATLLVDVDITQTTIS